MATSLSELRKRSGSVEELTRKTQLAARGSGKKDYDEKDERVWQCTPDDAGNGTALIRFLTEPMGEDKPYVRLYSHGFQGPSGKWYIENSRTTMEGEKDPVMESNNLLWKSGTDGQLIVSGDPKNGIKGRKRQLSYYSNILVINDPAKPENNGKVFLFRYGEQIFKIIEAKGKQGQFEDEKPVDVFDFWAGANFRLRMMKDGKYSSFVRSSFDTPTPMCNGDDAEIEKIWKQCYSLKELIAPEKFKTYEELEKRLNEVLSTSGKTSSAATSGELTPEDRAFLEQSSKKKAEPKLEVAKVDPPFDMGGSDGSADEPNLDYFANLAKGT